MTAGLDWTVLEAVRQGTQAIAEEMRHDLMRSARSPVLREAGDLSCAVTDESRRRPPRRARTFPCTSA